MRIAVVNWSRRQVGGIETYLSNLIPALASRGHAVAFWHEVDAPHDRQPIMVPDGVPSWCVEKLGTAGALAALGAWQPELIHVHGLLSTPLEAAVRALAPAVLSVHNYYGTCISGTKTWQRPVVRPCQQRFGAQCLWRYFPHRCGGLNPVTMLKQYRLQSQRLALQSGYEAVVVATEAMRAELLRQGLAAERLHCIPYFINAAGSGSVPPLKPDGATWPASPATPAHWQLLFSGRMERIKGGHVLLEALPLIIAALDRPVRATFDGDGSERAALEQQAVSLCASHRGLQIEFTGWQGYEEREALRSRSDLLVAPSLWPEPFGLVGPEAGLHGVPAAGFAVGGISEWLHDGVNGALAPSHPPTAAGLAQAIIRCLRDPVQHAQLRRGALRVAQQFNLDAHLKLLLQVFARATEHRRDRQDELALHAVTRVSH